ncbi:triphosphoribosyl-dephospho-CoA synthase [Metallosphaera hakonensis]|uniref:triphosphoribosyl-dephospho-CoA synthase n=1 Tax=Metallosphaera hakonensis TaxID=79601 RepID=UPI00209377B7|nr:triphosphoribosyl-dephospho-CoA synthase [Metallosphaera hakonensis]
MASIVEASIPKPGNASPFQDLETVAFRDIILSAMKLRESYTEACVRGYNRELPLMDLLYRVTDKRFALLGTAMLLLPLAYSSPTSRDLKALLTTSSQVIRSLGNEDWKWFKKSLEIISPSYLGKTEKMDYRQEDLSLWQVLNWSTMFDPVPREMVSGYPNSLDVFQILSARPCETFVSSAQFAFLHLLSRIPDGLISRKWGHRVAINVSSMARRILHCPLEHELEFFNEFLVRRKLNPGSTADLIASGIALYELHELYTHDFRSPLQRGCDRVT